MRVRRRPRTQELRSGPTPTLKKFLGRDFPAAARCVREKISPIKFLGPRARKEYPMSTPSKTLDAMSKNLTRDEKDARLEAEASVIPDRGEVVLKKPAWLKGKGKKYWDSILARMKGTAILDDLDAEMLAIYCAQLQERDALQANLENARKADDPDMELILSLTKQLNAKDSKIRDFASDLGCTPSGRVRLAQKRAMKASEAEPDGDLFGD